MLCAHTRMHTHSQFRLIRTVTELSSTEPGDLNVVRRQLEKRERIKTSALDAVNAEVDKPAAHISREQQESDEGDEVLEDESQ